MQSLQIHIDSLNFLFLTKPPPKQRIKLFPLPSNATLHPVLEVSAHTTSLEVPARSCQGDPTGGRRSAHTTSLDGPDRQVPPFSLPTQLSNLNSKTLTAPVFWAQHSLPLKSSHPKPLRPSSATASAQLSSGESASLPVGRGSQPSLPNACPRARCRSGQPPSRTVRFLQLPGPRTPTRPALPLNSAALEARLFPLLPPPRPVLTQPFCPLARRTRRSPLTFPVIARSCRHLCCPTSVGIGELRRGEPESHVHAFFRWAPGPMGYVSFRRHRHLVVDLSYYTFWVVRWTAADLAPDTPGTSVFLVSVFALRVPNPHHRLELAGFIPSLGETSPGEGHGTPLQYSCLENPMDGGAW